MGGALSHRDATVSDPSLHAQHVGASQNLTFADRNPEEERPGVIGEPEGGHVGNENRTNANVVEILEVLQNVFQKFLWDLQSSSSVFAGIMGLRCPKP